MRLAAINFVGKLCPDSPVALVGFSLSGNIVLKLLGEAPETVPANVTKAAAICPAIDLGRCVRSLVGPFQRVYDRYFVHVLTRQVRANCRLRPDVVPLHSGLRMKSIFEFDDTYTGPVCGFGSADNYYTSSSALRHIEHIQVPTLILAAEDDPLVTIACFRGLCIPSNVILHITRYGGHLGFVGKSGVDSGPPLDGLAHRRLGDGRSNGRCDPRSLDAPCRYRRFAARWSPQAWFASTAVALPAKLRSVYSKPDTVLRSVLRGTFAPRPTNPA